MSMRLELYADNIDDLRSQLADYLRSLSLSAAAAAFGSVPSGIGSALGMPSNPSTDSHWGHWERARQLGYSQGFNAGFGEACDRAAMDKSAYPRPEGMKDYPATTSAEAPEQAVNQYQVGPANTPLSKNPYLDPTAQAEQNRKTAAAIGQQRQEYYEQRQGHSMSSPETVADTLKQQGHPLPGE